MKAKIERNRKKAKKRDGPLKEERNNLVDKAIENAVLVSEEFGISMERRVRRMRRMAGEQARDAGLTLTEENKRAMLECADRFLSEFETRSKSAE